jgi:Ca2+-binding EF-hand superfamily protein
MLVPTFKNLLFFFSIEIDKNKEGIISTVEFRNVFRSLNIGLTLADIDALLA